MKMRWTTGIPALAVLVAGCVASDYYHQPGGPYYFKHGVTYQGFYPNKEITKPEAESLAASGYAFTVAFFNSDGLPTNVQKVYQGKIEFSADLTWTNRRMESSRVTNVEGKVTEVFFDEKGRPNNPQPEVAPYR